MPNLGFKILSYIWTSKTQVLDIDDSIPFSTQDFCPSDELPLKTLCTFVGQEGRQKIRVGCCDGCGYIGYIDRPAKEWITKFYLDTWKTAEFEKALNDIKKRQEQEPPLESQLILQRILQNINPDKARFACEIGCGYGDDLRFLIKNGFSKVVGIENSRHRAEIARQAYGIKVFTNPFEAEDTQAELKKLAPISFLFSRHVLEHVYNPAQIIGLCSNLQSVGDYLVIFVPNVLEEPPLEILLFLPHLHSFSKQSLANLLNRYSYEIVDNPLTSDREICLVARRTATPIFSQLSTGNYDLAVEKFINNLGLEKKYISSTRRLWWDSYYDFIRQSLYFRNDFLNQLYFRIILKINRLLSRKKIVLISTAAIEDIKNPYTSYRQSPIEIQFDKNIKLLYK